MPKAKLGESHSSNSCQQHSAGLSHQPLHSHLQVMGRQGCFSAKCVHTALGKGARIHLQLSLWAVLGANAILTVHFQQKEAGAALGWYYFVTSY